MDDKTLRRVQLVMLDMVKDIATVCEENGIRYFLDGGTLLGAVRHHGFIPWDDDFDIGMLREDYEKFLRLAPEKLDGKYYVQNMRTDADYGLWFTKVRLRGTLFEEAAASQKQKERGIFIDVFPYDNFPDDKAAGEKTVARMEFYKRCLLSKARYSTWNTNHGYSLLRHVCYKALGLGVTVLPRSFIVGKIDALATQWNGVPSRELTPLGLLRYGKMRLDRAWFAETELAPFEDTQLRILCHSHEMLTAFYGDYMTPPPESERQNRHNIRHIRFPDGTEIFGQDE